MIAFTTEDVTLSMCPPLRPRIIQAQAAGGLCYHPTMVMLNGEFDGYTITHIASGLGVYSAHTEQQIVAAIQVFLASGIDWTQGQVPVTEAMREQRATLFAAVEQAIAAARGEARDA